MDKDVGQTGPCQGSIPFRLQPYWTWEHLSDFSSHHGIRLRVVLQVLTELTLATKPSDC